MEKIYRFRFYILIAAGFLLTRLLNLGIIPIFTDEAIYSYWSQIALNDPANRYISLVDGKQPLFIWISAAFQSLISDPLIATRMTSVLSGALALIGIYLVSRELFSQKVAKIASILYVIMPFTLLYDRMALYDSLLTMLGLFAVYFAIRMIKTPRLDLALLNGMTIGLGLLTKSSANFYIFYIPLTLLLLSGKIQEQKPKLIKWFYLSFVTVILAQVIYNTLRLSPYFYIISQKNLSFIRPFGEVIQNPFLHLNSNLTAIATWLTSYLGIPLLAFLVLSTLYFAWKRNIKVLYLSLLVLMPLLAEGFFNIVLYPRFVLFYFPYMLIIISLGLSKLLESKSKYQKFVKLLIPVLFLFPLFNSFLLLTNPKAARIANSDLGQYLNDWPAGYGVKESVGIIRQSEKSQTTYVGTEGTFGLLPYALQIYFFGDQKVNIAGFWPVDATKIPEQVLDATATNRVYFIFNENQSEISNPRLKLVSKYQKGTGKSYLRVFEVLPK